MVEMDCMFLHTSNVEAAYICGVCVILILGLLLTVLKYQI